MRNEELAQRVKNNERGALLELWKAVHKFVEMQARRRSLLSACTVPFEDLVQAGFLATVEAAQKYEHGKGYGFLTALNFYLLRYFAKEDGISTSKRDALKYACSMDEKIKTDQGEESPLSDFIEDKNASHGFIGAEYEEFILYCRRLIVNALETLTDRQKKAVWLYYFDRLTFEDVANECDLSGRNSAKDVIFRALNKLLCGKYSVLMRECLEIFEDFRNYDFAVQSSGIGRFKNTGMSSTEAAAFMGV